MLKEYLTGEPEAVDYIRRYQPLISGLYDCRRWREMNGEFTPGKIRRIFHMFAEQMVAWGWWKYK